MLDFSQQRELGLHAEVIAEMQAVAATLGVQPLIIGAFARDLLLNYAHRIPVMRQTEDIDVALAIDGWSAFAELRERLVSSGRFAETTSVHRLQHGALPIDLVPFGRVETVKRTIAWPPHGNVVMDVFGFQEAQRAAVEALLPNSVRVQLVSLPALALLKLVCWQDRRLRSPRKDASDLQLVVSNYLEAGNDTRLWQEFVHWTQENDFDYEAAGARMLGHDIALLLEADGRNRITALLEVQTDLEAPGALPIEMNDQRPEQAIRLLAELLRGLREQAR
ncbi:MAG: nucleotidyl transferase AbiEii/AbiGii toxin family protein [Acidobacteria bacterium]|nr:nucleotidyl transferase AbiEii/AbiGii toxin family protein [Acidobacteriota bacterium]